MGYRNIGVTAHEMRKMREEGMSNHDIAKALDISTQTVLNYIGKQGKKMECLRAFRDKPLCKKATEPVEDETPCIPPYNPTPLTEVYEIAEGTIRVEMDYVTEIITLEDGNGDRFTIHFAEVSHVTQFLAWAMREKMGGSKCE